MDKTTIYEFVSLASALLFALFVWPPSALIIIAAACAFLAWLEERG